MPSNYVKLLAQEKGVSYEKAKDRWQRAKDLAKEQGQADNYAYITSIFKSMMGESLVDHRVQKFLDSEEINFDKFLENLSEESPMMSSDFVAPEKVADEEDENFESDILKVLDESNISWEGNGIMGGYSVNFIREGNPYILKTVIGIRCRQCPVIVKYNSIEGYSVWNKNQKYEVDQSSVKIKY